MAVRTTNPATGEVLREFPLHTDAEIQTALNTADTCYRSDWRRRPVAERAAFVARAAAILREKRDEYAQILCLEMGKVITQAYFEVDISADILEYYAKNGERFLAPMQLPEAPGSTVVTEPIGVILAVEPWNYPYYQIARVAGPQIVAGNVLIMKHASNVPQSALAFARLFEEAEAPAGVYSNVFCSADQIGTLIDDFRVRGVTLTGSERAGAIIGERSGRNLKKVVLELGGSDPAIVLEDAPIDVVIGQCVPGRLMNTGQACASIKRVIVVGRERGEQILERFVASFRDLVIGDPLDPSSVIGPVVSKDALDGLLGQIEEATAAGAKVAFGGRQIDRPGFYLEPTILTDIAEDNPFFQQEAFGPILSFYVVDSEEEALRIANATKFGLGSSIFSADIEHAKEVASEIEAGMVFINSYVYSAPEVPFGGVKNSGFGRELSELGIGEFVNRKLVRVADEA